MGQFCGFEFLWLEQKNLHPVLRMSSPNWQAHGEEFEREQAQQIKLTQDTPDQKYPSRSDP